MKQERERPTTRGNERSALYGHGKLDTYDFDLVGVKYKCKNNGLLS
jgi:hypothetical protein